MSAFHLQQLFVLHGGRTSVQLKKQTITHVFCTNLSGSKTDAVHRSLGKASQPLIIHPAWIVSSIEAGRRLPTHDFLVVKAKQRGMMAALPATMPTIGQVSSTL